jgi:hypothetical protein
MLLLGAILGCGAAPESTATTNDAISAAADRAAVAEGRDRHSENAQAFDPHSRPFGTSMERWAERLWDWVYSIPTAQNPLLDTTGVDCAVNQPDGPVWYLPPVIDPGGVASFTRTCTIPHGRALLMLNSGVLNDFPCPDPTFKPADGQTLFELLLAGAQGGPNSLNGYSLLVDGTKVLHIFDYRETSDDLFTIKGDPSLATSLDGCVTGSNQPAVSDAMVIMLRPLPPGPHTLVYHLTDPHGVDLTVTYQLTQQ